jgi:hypothetical protein
MRVAEREMSLADDEVSELRSRVERLEAENAELAARANAAVAAAQDRVYWLDRWGIDLNALMRRSGADKFRAALRGVRWVVRRMKKIKQLLAR